MKAFESDTRDDLIERQILGAVDLPHAAAAEQGDNTVTARNRLSATKRPDTFLFIALSAARRPTLRAQP